MGFRIQLTKNDSSYQKRPDLTLEDEEKKYIWICDMACPQEINVEEKKERKANKI